MPTATRPERSPAGKRGGFSLLEVLIAMFILTVGMLGIAAVVVIGNMSAMRALIADRTAVVGRNALSEVRVRDWLDPVRWVTVQGSPVVSSRDQPLPVGESFCIDPLYIAQINNGQGAVPNALSPDLARFPYNPPGTAVSMQRITVNIAANPNAPANVQAILMNPQIWKRIVVSEDDLVFDPSRLSRPRLLFRTDTGAAVPLPPLPGDTGSGNPLYADYQGMYSWMITVVPQVPRIPSGTQKYLVSAVVFRDRNFLWRDDPTVEVPGERVATANFLGGGDLRLSIPASRVKDAAQADEYLRVPEGQYLLLAGRALVSSNPPVMQNVFLWYRVVASGDLVNQNQNYFREVTVAGPDWNIAWCVQTNNDTDGDGVPVETQAVLCTNVYGVYTEVIDPEVLSRASFAAR
ncbi:prepilin-type N-terminal cleavage/methylation domain-containing protein [Thermogutta sp.]|uniref:type IV pilus modification PilV family protein n=1 Tax=Thermogutta sp. TaxID=1962930 RepID=UPI00321F66E1